jgi:hypothetical protein
VQYTCAYWHRQPLKSGFSAIAEGIRNLHRPCLPSAIDSFPYHIQNLTLASITCSTCKGSSAALLLGLLHRALRVSTQGYYFGTVLVWESRTAVQYLGLVLADVMFCHSTTAIEGESMHE